MKPLTWARVDILDAPRRLLRSATDRQRALFWRIVSVIKNAPEDGLFYRQEPDNTVLRQMTGAEMHVIYAVKYWPIGRVLQVVTIEIRDWEPRDG
jgi:hypothetical protein